MHVITRKRLVEFAANHPHAAKPLDDWFRAVQSRRFFSPDDLKTFFPSASFLGNGLTIFNIAGNRYRLATTMRYDLGRVFVRRVMTHAEYDRRSAEGTL